MPEAENLTPKQASDHYRNRRRMAWVSLCSILLLAGYLIDFGLGSDESMERVNGLSFLIGTVFSICATIILAYIGSATLAKIPTPD